MTYKGSFIGMMTPFTWMFLSSYEKLRKRILNKNTLTSLVRPEYHAFFDSAYVPICAFTLITKSLHHTKVSLSICRISTVQIYNPQRHSKPLKIPIVVGSTALPQKTSRRSLGILSRIG